MQPLALYGTGKVAVQYDQVLGPTEADEGNWKLDPALSEARHGELAVGSEGSGEGREGSLHRLGQRNQRPASGLGVRPARSGPTVTAKRSRWVIRVRNVGKEAVKFEYLKQFFIDEPPSVTDGKGKAVRLFAFLRGRRPVSQAGGSELAPGKETELYELNLNLQPEDTVGGFQRQTLLGTGKFSVQYERVIAHSSSGTITLDPTLSKLATGQLELEVNQMPPAATEKK